MDISAQSQNITNGKDSDELLMLIDYLQHVIRNGKIVGKHGPYLAEL